MGWASGSILFSDIIEALIKNIEDEEVREVIYKSIIPAFEDMDCDTLDECKEIDDAFDNVYRDMYPEEDIEDEEE